ncbi:MAG: metallophosphoesterase family protein [Wolinella sp.]
MNKAWLNEDTFIISDTHFGHEKILVKEPLRVQLAEQEIAGIDPFEWALKRWNLVVSPKDHVLHLGDVIGKHGKRYIHRLNGKKHVLLGNHDINNLKELHAAGFELLKGIHFKIDTPKGSSSAILKALHKRFSSKELYKALFVHALVADFGGERILFSHFPVFDSYPENRRYERGKRILEALYEEAGCTLNIHGHTHSNDTKNSFCINVSADKSVMIPRKLGEVLSRNRA